MSRGAEETRHSTRPQLLRGDRLIGSGVKMVVVVVVVVVMAMAKIVTTRRGWRGLARTNCLWFLKRVMWEGCR